METQHREHNGVKYTLKQGRRGIELHLHDKRTDDYIFEVNRFEIVGNVCKIINKKTQEGARLPS